MRKGIKKMKKKIVLLLCVATMACMSFTACGSDSNEPATEETAEENTLGDVESDDAENVDDATEAEDANEAAETEDAGEVEETNAEDVNAEESESGEVLEEVAPEDAAPEDAGETVEENVEVEDNTEVAE